MSMGSRTLLLALLLFGAAYPLNTTSVVPTKVAVFDAQNGMGLGNDVIYDGTPYANASDNVYANTSGRDTVPSWAQANFSLSFPPGAKVLDAALVLEHQQSAAGQITVNVSANNGTGWYWNACSFPPLSAAGVDSFNYCNLTGYVTANVSLLQVYLNITYLGGVEVESIDLLALNYTYIIAANLTGQAALQAPANGTVIDSNSTFNQIGRAHV
jgi:hypothetical protein